MEGAERQSVSGNVGSEMTVPPYMGSFESRPLPDRKLKRIIAHCTSVTIGPQNLVSEIRIAHASGTQGDEKRQLTVGPRRLQSWLCVSERGLEDRETQGLGEVVFGDSQRNREGRVRILTQRRIERFTKAASNFERPKARRRYASIRLDWNLIGPGDFPDPVFLHPPERLLRLVDLARRAERPKEREKRPMDDVVVSKPTLAPETSSNGPKRKKGLVRGAFIAPPPDGQPVKLPEKGFGHACS